MKQRVFQWRHLLLQGVMSRKRHHQSLNFFIISVNVLFFPSSVIDAVMYIPNSVSTDT